MASLLHKILPLAADPFPPTHKAGSEFEGFFIRLESHSGRSQASSANKSETKPSKSAHSSPSRIPRLLKSRVSTPRAKVAPKATGEGAPLRHRQHRSSSSSSDGSSSSSAQSGPPSPTPSRPNFTHPFASSSRENGSMLTDIDPVFASPESYLPPSANPTSHGKVRNTSASLPATAPGDLILVVCELQSAPIDQRICIYLRWIVHGEESSLYRDLHGDTAEKGKLPSNAKERQRESFQIIRYIPSWQLRVGTKVDSSSVQPFRIDLPNEEAGGGSLGFMEVSPDGNVAVDLILANPSRTERGGEQVGTRLRLRSTKYVPWHPTSSVALPMGSRGPEGPIQHLGALLPLHWYVHSSSAPAIFSLEHTALSSPSSRKGSSDTELNDAVAAGRGLLHVEKNWGQAFPSGWMWAHGASPLLDPSYAASSSTPPQPTARLSLAGGSILGLTAFLVGIHIRHGSETWDWNFTPPFALGPKHTFTARPGERVHLGPGLHMRRDFAHKTFTLDVWTPAQWAHIDIDGAEHSFATQIPGPRKGGWSPGYCHHSYRCRAKIALYQRSLAATVTLPLRAATHPISTLRTCKRFFARPTQSKEIMDEWSGFGWHKVVEAQLNDRVALEFGGDFAQ